MAYPVELRNKAEDILQQRRDNVKMEQELRSSEAMMKIPELADIQRGLSQVGLGISQLFFYGEESEAKLNELRDKSKELVAKREKLLVQNGFAPDALKPQYTCSYCEDKGFIDGRICKCHRELLIELMRKQVSRLAPIDKCTFSNFSLDYYSVQPNETGISPRNRAEKVLEACRNYSQNFSMDSKNLLFVGGAGLGKTHLSLAIMNVVINKGYYACYGTSQNICDDLQSEQFGRTDNITYTKKQVLNCDLLVLDDLGTEIENQYSIATLYNIINTRILSGKPTIISTNHNIGSFDDKYDKRITSRLMGEYVQLYLFGDDIRNM